MLRPTDSPIIFIQQLGRGLRKTNEKSFLTVLDFIGNHNKAFLIAIALNGSRYYDKDSLKVAVATQFANIPGCTNIQMDRVSQERILEQLTNENFNSMKYLREEYNEFKKMNSGRIPYFLIDYEKFDGAPDPLKFINKHKTYIGFVCKIEKDDKLKRLLENVDLFKLLREWSGKLPIKRPFEFCVIKYLLKQDSINFNQAKAEVLKHMDFVADESILHAMHYLNQEYYDESQKKSGFRAFELKDNILSVTWNFKKLIQNKEYRKYIDDLVNYALIRYQKEFGNTYYGLPFFKLYEQYQMADPALLSNYAKIHSSFRGSGLLTNGKEYFLYIDLHKEENIKESINYKDKFIDQEYFQWQTQNSTSSDSERGKNIIYNKSRGVKLHIFVRKYKEVDGVTQQYIYIGKGDAVGYEGEKPITVKIKLEHPLPISIYTEFIKKV